MAISKKTNPTPTLTEAKVAPEAILRSIVVAAGAFRTAACTLCYGAAAFILRVNHFADAKSKEYMTKPDAIEFLQKEISKQAGVLGNMCNLYVRNASALAGILTGSMKMFSPTIQQLANATTPDQMISILSNWMETNHGRRIESLSNLSEALGYKTSRPVAAAKLTAETAVAKVTNALKVVEKAMDTKGLRLPEKTLAQAVVGQVKNKSTVAREAIRQIRDVDELHALITFIREYEKELKASLSRLADKATEAVKQDTKTKSKSKPGARSPRQAPARTQV